MKREFLEGMKLANDIVFSKEEIDKIMTEHGKTVNKEKEKLSTLNEKYEITKEKLENYKKNAEKVENLVNENKGLKEKYDKIKADFDTGIATKDKEIANINKSHALISQLKENGAVDPDLLTGKFNLDNLELNDLGKIKDFDTYLKPIKENYKNQFSTTTIEGQKPGGSNGVNDDDFKNPFSKDHWNLTEQVKLFKKDPDLYNKLKK